jgi:phosphoribosylformylglycinamidine synthase
MDSSFAFSKMTDEEIARALEDNKVALSVDEAKQVEALLGRPPTLTEAIVWGIQGSEHCSYKSSRSHLKSLPTEAPNIMLGVGEDAGIVTFAEDKVGKRYGLIMAHESHNSPSHVVPYEGAATGVGGIVRDIIVMGGRAVASADALRFGQPDRPLTQRIAQGVVEGIGGYGNPLGVPNLTGDVYFDESFNENCLVNVVALGALREDEIIHSYAPETAEGYEVIIVGKPTDNSGMGGAAFASREVKEEEKTTNKGAVQEPNPFLERHLAAASYALFEKLKQQGELNKVSLKDMGAGGNVCATVEQLEHNDFGAEIDLSKVHTSLEGLHPSVIACAETQERICWICDPSLTQQILKHYNEDWDLPGVSVGARASVVGKVTRGNYVVKFGDEVLLDAKAKDVTKGVVAERPFKEPQREFTEPELEMPNLEASFKALLARPNIASRLPIYENYDKVVQGQTVIQTGHADAGLLAPFVHRAEVPEIHKVGAALAVAAVPRYGLISPYWSGVNAVAESMRRVAALGATPWAATDCLNYGNPEIPEQMWELVEGIRGVKEALEGVGHLDYESPLPVVSGNVSLYKQSKNGSVAPSPIIGMVGRMDNVDKAVNWQLKAAGNALYLIGARKDECGGSEYYAMQSELGAQLPQPDFKTLRSELELMIAAVDQSLIQSSSVIGVGGLALALTKMMVGGRGEGQLGMNIQMDSSLRADTWLFSETGGFVVEVQDAAAFEALCTEKQIQPIRLGEVTEAPSLKIDTQLNLELSELKDIWLSSLRNLFTT